MSQPDLIISGEYLLPEANRHSLLKNHGIAVCGDTITAIAPTEQLASSYPGAKRLHTPRGLLMPGLINTHTHAAMSCFRGIADDLPLMKWLEDYIFPAEAKLNSEMVYHSTLLSIAEMLRSGTTSFCDMYLFAKDVARAVDKAGIRGWVGEVLYDFPSPCYGELENGFKYVNEMFSHYRTHPLIHITADPHSVYTCSPDLLNRLWEVAQDERCLYHIHLSENQAEVDTCKERYGCTPVQHLEHLGVLSESTLAAHCVILQPEDIELLAARGVKVSHCLESNMKLASGIAPIPDLLAAGANISVGTDGSASNNDVDMFGEMSSVAKVHKAMRLDPTVMDAETTLKAATLGGAQAMGVDEDLGTLELGKKADCIVLDTDQPHLSPCYNPISHLVYAARGGDVIHSIINGRIVMENRRLTCIDEDAVLHRMHQIATTIGISESN